ncbi:Na+/H+ antiporter [Pararcticibacter amylolyticus]|uniref:Na+/H+ antiporter n=1 Tax=Pararcticibacter amylolyticus TaxID=2173175 RepID=A0A2U2PMG2_9SPHI|nr:Na+/H+ antiporter [Pararcticibacter amylolyticus]PWG82587.1 Na+/H+ antiporter [Pararcticibacter amylolyticus]
MENYTAILTLLGIMIILHVISDRVKISSPIFLVLGGVGLGFIPDIPPLSINPEIIFLLFLPPLLYDASFNISFKAFKEHLGTISSLAIGLVFLTTAGIAVFARFLIPGIDWPLAFVLGAILASTDAVAAIGITKGLKLSHTTTTILEGESLINDASALVAYRFAVAAVTGTAFVLWKASLTFLILMAGGFLVGVVMAKTLQFLLRFVRGHTMAVLSFTLLAPFITYLIAEELHCSGVIAVVVLGFGISRLSSLKFPESLRQQSRTIWEIVVFLLNGLIFILIGLELPAVIKSIPASPLLQYSAYAFLITLVAVLIRTLRVFLKKNSLQRAFNHPKFKNTRREIPASVLFTTRESLIISLSGMRGIVSLAVAIGLPHVLEDGTPFPMRSEIIYITTVAVLVSIVGQGLLLPFLIKKLNKSSGDL